MTQYSSRCPIIIDVAYLNMLTCLQATELSSLGPRTTELYSITQEDCSVLCRNRRVYVDPGIIEGGAQSFAHAHLYKHRGRIFKHDKEAAGSVLLIAHYRYFDNQSLNTFAAAFRLFRVQNKGSKLNCCSAVSQYLWLYVLGANYMLESLGLWLPERKYWGCSSPLK